MLNTAEVLDNPFEGWVTLDEASRIVNRDHSTIRFWADTDRITAYRIGNSRVRVVNVEEVKEYSEQATRIETPKRKRRSGSRRNE